MILRMTNVKTGARESYRPADTATREDVERCIEEVLSVYGYTDFEIVEVAESER